MRINRQASREPELPVVRAIRTPFAQKSATARKSLDALAVVPDVDSPLRTDRYGAGD